MPEGDTILRTATTLRPAMEKGRIEAARLRDGQFDAARTVGCVVVAVEARGKHLLMHLAADAPAAADRGDLLPPTPLVLHSHMGMTGSWHIYRPGQKWLKPESHAALVLSINDLDVICFSPKQLELLSADQFRRHRYIQQLGPDLLAARFDLDNALARFRTRGDLPLGEAVMNQSLACGVGNVYKSEALFLMQFDPFAPVALYSDKELSAMFAATRRLMRLNRVGGVRVTRFGSGAGRHWVYGRSGQPCPKCGAPIQLRRQGDAGRTTYWCPVCQPPRTG